jgi:diaminopimelate decarboxylase
MNPFDAQPKETPLSLSSDYIRAFSAGFLENRQRYLDAVTTFGSPLYFIETAVLLERAAQFKRAFASRLPRTAYYYAMKSNNLAYISDVLLSQGYGLDVSSGLELTVAVSLGATDIMFSGPGKTDAELELAAAHPDRVTLLLDSAGECRRLATILARRQTSMGVGIRLNINPEGLWRKFGIPLDALPDLYETIRQHPCLEFRGLQFHSSWNLTPGRQIEFLNRLGRGLAAMPEHFMQALTFVDIGGGYWPPQGEWLLSGDTGHYLLNPGTPIDLFAEQLADVIRRQILERADCRICFEPGRWICNDAMHLLMRVIDRKSPDLVITDAGTNAVGWERFESDYFPVLNLSNYGLCEHNCHILGALCIPHDVWGFSFLGTDIQEGDVLMIPTQGAYTYSLRQHFIKALPKVVVHENGRFFSGDRWHGHS